MLTAIALNPLMMTLVLAVVLIIGVLVFTTVIPALVKARWGDIFGMFLIGGIFAAYFMPTIIALFKDHINTLAIFLMNLLLGWTIIGWFGALFWAAIN